MIYSFGSSSTLLSINGNSQAHNLSLSFVFFLLLKNISTIPALEPSFIFVSKISLSILFFDPEINPSNEL